MYAVSHGLNRTKNIENFNPNPSMSPSISAGYHLLVPQPTLFQLIMANTAQRPSLLIYNPAPLPYNPSLIPFYNLVLVSLHNYLSIPQSMSTSPPPQSTFKPSNQNSRFNRRSRDAWLSPLPISITAIYRQRLNAHQIVPVPVRPLTPPYLSWYNPNACCKYHDDITGYSTENCRAIKGKSFSID